MTHPHTPPKKQKKKKKPWKKYLGFGLWSLRANPNSLHGVLPPPCVHPVSASIKSPGWKDASETFGSSLEGMADTSGSRTQKKSELQSVGPLNHH